MSTTQHASIAVLPRRLQSPETHDAAAAQCRIEHEIIKPFLPLLAPVVAIPRSFPPRMRTCIASSILQRTGLALTHKMTRATVPPACAKDHSSGWPERGDSGMPSHVNSTAVAERVRHARAWTPCLRLRHHDGRGLLFELLNVDARCCDSKTSSLLLHRWVLSLKRISTQPNIQYTRRGIVGKDRTALFILLR